MKKILVIFIILLLNNICYSQKKIGTIDNENILEIFKKNEDIVYSCVTEKEGMISIIQEFYCVVNEKKYGPFDKQPVINKMKTTYYVEVQYENKFGYIINNTLLGLYDEIKEIVFSNDETKYCFIYLDNTDNKSYIIENGKVIIEKDSILKAFYSPDNKLCYTYIVREGKHIYPSFITIGNDTFGPYRNIKELGFSSDGDYFVELSKSNDKNEYVLCNGKEYLKKDFSKIYYEYSFSNIRKDENGYYYTDGTLRSPSFDLIEETTFINSLENPKDFGFRAKKGEQYYYVKNFETVYGPYKDVSKYPGIYFEPVTEKLYYSVQDSENHYSIYKEGVLCISGTGNLYPYFSSNGKICVYKESTDKGDYIIFGKEKVGPYDLIRDVVISNDGSKIAYSATIGDELYVFDGLKRYGPYLNVSSLNYSPNNDIIFFYYDHSYDGFIYYKGKTIGSYEYIGIYNTPPFSFSTNGEYFIYSAKSKNTESENIYMNDRPVGLIKEGYLCGTNFSEDGQTFICIGLNPFWIFYNGKIININTFDFDSFYYYKHLAYTESKGNLIISSLLINGKKYIGQYSDGEFIYVDNHNIMLLSK